MLEMISLQNLAGTILPLLAILFVCTIAIVNLFYKVRKLFPVRVNCWFCNTDTKVPYDDNNSWVCPSCTQYNGFTEDGDYNREIPAQYQRKLNPSSNITDDDKISYSVPQNGLCFGCNRNQELKIHQLASFVPEVEENYDEEVEEYERQLEVAYKLCSRCERVVKRTLNDVKRNILGSKLAQIGTKGLKVFDLHMQANDKQHAFRKRRIVTNVCLWAIILMLGIKIGQKIMEFEFSKDRLELVFSPMVSQTIVVVISYVVALKRALFARWTGIIEQPLIVNGVDQLNSVRKLVFGNLDEKLSISEAICEALNETPEIMDQKNSLSDLALICLATMLITMKSHIRNWKPIIIILFCGAEMLVIGDIGLEVFENRIYSTVLENILSSLALITAISCIGQTAPKIQPSDNMSSSFHKIYSNQGNECDNYDTLNDNSSLLEDASVCSQRTFGNNDSGKSIDTTRSISPSALTASTLRPFMDSTFNTTSPNKSHFGGSTLHVDRISTTIQENPFCGISHRSPIRTDHSLMKTPSFSVGNFTTAIPAASERSFPKHGFSMNAINDPTLQGEEHFGKHIDRLSISGRVSSVSRKDLSLTNNPFASHHVDHDESFSLRQRKVTLTPPHLDTVAESGGSWIAGGYWSPQKSGDAEPEFHNHPFMSRTSSQSSGFESQPTRRPTPEDSAGNDFDQLSLFSEPVGIFPSRDSSTFQHPNPRLNQTLTYPLSQSSPTPSHASIFSRQTANASRNLFGERSLFQTDPSTRMFPPHNISTYSSGMATSQQSFFSARSNVFPPQQSQTPVFGSTSNLCHPNPASSFYQGHRRPVDPTSNNKRRSLLNLSKLSEVPEVPVPLAEKLSET